LSPNPDGITSARPHFEVADIFRKHIGEYKRIHRLSYEQNKAVNAIMNCRTPALGGVLRLCDHAGCGHWEFSYKSCKNRHCPKCGAFEKAQWLEAQKIWLLPIPYFHVVFTIDHVFNPLVWWNPEVLYAHLIDTAAHVLKAYGRKYLGGELGFTLVLHTWGRASKTSPPAFYCYRRCPGRTAMAIVGKPPTIIFFQWKNSHATFARRFVVAYRNCGKQAV
jgi:hypothetical protein